MPRKKKNPGQEAVKTEKRSDKLPARILGMKDYPGSEYSYYGLANERAYELANLHGFSSIKTPVIESVDLFKKALRRGTGKESYIVNCDKGEKGVLRPELTQGMIRAYLESRDPESPIGAKLFSLGPVFRYEKLQAGHYREATQFDIEVIGDDKAISEALLIALVYDYFNSLGVRTKVQINSLGNAECRREYSAKLTAFYKERGRRSKLCNLCKAYLGKNSLSLLDCHEESCLKLIEEAPQIADFLSPESREHFAKIIEALDELGEEYDFNPYLVRGLSYYNETVFEFWPLNENGTVSGKNALAGGGRYDSLSEIIGGPAISAFGVAVGIERTVSRMKDKPLLPKINKEDIVFIAQLGEQAKIKAVGLFKELKEAGINVHDSFLSDSLKNQLEEAVKIGAKTCLILGKKEIMDGTILMRDIESGAQETLVYKKVRERLAKKDKIIEKRLIHRKEETQYGGF